MVGWLLRPVAVSAYFHDLRTSPKKLRGASLDEYVLQFLPVVCKWLTIRYFVFAEALADKSTIFWYGDAKDSPEDWHDTFYDLVGLRMPANVKSRAVDVAIGRASDSRLSSFPSKGIDVHLGQEDPAASDRTFRYEVRPETLLEMDTVLEVWLPPFLLRKFGVGLM